MAQFSLVHWLVLLVSVTVLALVLFKGVKALSDRPRPPSGHRDDGGAAARNAQSNAQRGLEEMANQVRIQTITSSTTPPPPPNFTP